MGKPNPVIYYIDYIPWSVILNLENEVGLTPENQLMLSIISIGAEKLLIKVNKSKAFHGKKEKTQKTKNWRKLSQLGKGHLWNSHITLCLTVRQWKLSVLITSMQHDTRGSIHPG